jgi:hypothetical protein
MDDRLRSGLHEVVADFEPDVERHLSIVTRRSRRRSRPLPAAVLALVGATSALALVLVYGPGELAEPAASVTPASSQSPVDPADALVGTYRVHLDDRMQVPDPSLVGDWELAFDTDSRVALTGPPSFVSSAEAPLGGYAYAIRGDSMSTNLLTRQLGHECAGPGSYRWLEEDGRLTFETIDDMCPQRVTILTTRDWTRVDG